MTNRKTPGEILLQIDRVEEDAVKAEEHPQEVADNLSTLTLLMEVIILEEVDVDLVAATTLKDEVDTTLREEEDAAAIEAVVETHSEEIVAVEETLANLAAISAEIVEVVSEADEEMAMISRGAGDAEETTVTFKGAEAVDLAAASTTSALVTRTTQMTITKGDRGEVAATQSVRPNYHRPLKMAPSLTCRICNNQARAGEQQANNPPPMNNERAEET